MRNSAFSAILCVATVILATAPTQAAEPLAPADQQRLAVLQTTELHSLSNVDLADFLRLKTVVDGQQEPARKLQFFAQKGLQQPYRLASVRFDLSSGDCVVFVESVLAMTLSTDWPSYYKLRQRLSHKDGVVSVLERNFFALGDWVPSNAWLLADVTTDLGVPTQEFSYTIRRKEFLENLHFGETHPVAGLAKAAAKAAKIASVPEVETRQDRYIPRDEIPAALPQLRTGDVCLVIRAPKPEEPWPDCDHMGLIVVAPDGTVTLVHSAPPRARQEELREFLGHYRKIIGLKFLRLRPDAEAQVARELARTGPAMLVPSPDEEDARNVQLRALRQGQ